MLRRSLAALTLLLATAALAGCGSSDDSTATDPSGASPSVTDGASCTYTTSGSAAKAVDLPPDPATVSGSVDVTIATSAGDLGATLDADATPCTVNSFVSLAGQGYYDDTPCHRLTTAGIFVLQCGDPTGTGSGGPGYSYPDELSGQETYPAGTLAMANAGPDTNGSQFFLVYDDTTLGPAYTVFGTLDAAGLKVVQEIAKGGSDDANGQGDGAPLTKVDITSVTVD